MKSSQTSVNGKNPTTNTDFVFSAIDLEERDGAFAIDLVAWRMSQITFCLVGTKDTRVSHDGAQLTARGLNSDGPHQMSL